MEKEKRIAYSRSKRMNWKYKNVNEMKRLPKRYILDRITSFGTKDMYKELMK
jgi:hypothetical protein